MLSVPHQRIHLLQLMNFSCDASLLPIVRSLHQFNFEVFIDNLLVIIIILNELSASSRSCSKNNYTISVVESIIIYKELLCIITSHWRRTKLVVKVLLMWKREVLIQLVVSHYIPYGAHPILKMTSDHCVGDNFHKTSKKHIKSEYEQYFHQNTSFKQYTSS